VHGSEAVLPTDIDYGSPWVVCPRQFHVGDLVLRWVQGNKERHKLSPPWDGPFIIHEVLRPGTYKIQYEHGRVITNAWNIEHLRLFYP
jgi:hypothetical protein